MNHKWVQIKFTCECGGKIGVTCETPGGGQAGHAPTETITCPNCGNQTHELLPGHLVSTWLAGKPANPTP